MRTAQLIDIAPTTENAPFRFKMAGFLVDQLVSGAKLDIYVQNQELSLQLGDRDKESYYIMSIDQPETLWNIIRNPDPGLGESYMRGEWELERGNLGAFLTMLTRGRQRLFESPAGKIYQSLLYLKEPPDYSHDPINNKRQVRHHYDLGNDLYELFLDSGMNYSCAFFKTPQSTLEQAQLNKIRTAIRRLDIRPGMRVLDIGSGWGTACRVIAEETGAAQVSGITLSENQLAFANQHHARAENSARFFLEDYREHAEQHENYYDRIVSIGMFEHVGHENHHEYFNAVHRMLKPGGRALVHSIVRPDGGFSRVISSPWLDKYIFPGGCIPKASAIVKSGRACGLKPLDEPFIHEPFHYAETLRRWRRNFMANRSRLDPQKYDEKFERMWLYYLAMCEAIFDGCRFRVAQVVFTKT